MRKRPRRACRCPPSLTRRCRAAIMRCLSTVSLCRRSRYVARRKAGRLRALLRGLCVARSGARRLTLRRPIPFSPFSCTCGTYDSRATTAANRSPSPSQIVEATVDRLAPERAVEFIDRIVYKFERNPNRGLSLSVWIHAILLRHAAYLMTVPDLVARLRPIYQVCTPVAHLRHHVRCRECRLSPCPRHPRCTVRPSVLCPVLSRENAVTNTRLMSGECCDSSQPLALQA